MPSNPVPDYELADAIELTSAQHARALSDPLRTTILGLLHERAASVTELASAVQRPKGTVAYHVSVLMRAGLLRVVRTRRVRAVEESFYGRTARMFYVSLGRPAQGEALPQDFNDFEIASRESAAAFESGQLRSFIRHARIPEERAAEFWQTIDRAIREFECLPRAVQTSYGFAVGLYPILGYPTLPPRPGEAD